ncbi:hypothetical protein FACS1894139_06620 [Planctomycetales bacterium]|nr:hypothetical protein FACS1894107_03950 [Planctomycetales bacterium]GHT04454.1 hypothetical protein FACS1894139_06620 [Planctomycetales bacterium]
MFTLARNAKLWRYLAGLLAVGYVGLLIFYTAPIAIEADQCSYFAAARYIADDGAFHYRDFINQETVGYFFVIVNEKFYPHFGVGYPLLLAATIKIFGAGAEYYFTTVCAGLVVLAMYAFSRLFLPRLYAFLGAFLLVASPTFFFNAQIKNTHTLGVLLTLIALYALLATARRAIKTTKIADDERSIAGAALCGFLLGYNVLVHYTEILLLLAPLTYVLTARKLRRRWTLLAAGVGGAAMPLAWLGLWHYAHFGSPFKTSYSFYTGASNNFSLAYFVENLWLYLPGMCNYGLGVAGGALALAVGLKFRGVKTAPNWFWLAWILPLGLAYHFYFWSSPDLYPLMLRYWEPFFPALIIVGLIGLRQLWRDYQNRVSPKFAAGLLAGFIALQFLWSVTFTAPSAEMLYGAYQRAYRQVCFITQQVPSGAFLFAPYPEKNAPVCDNEIVMQHRWHFFVENVFELQKFQDKQRAEYEKREKNYGNTAPHTEQTLSTERMLRRSPDVMFASFYRQLRGAAAAGVPMYYVGNVETYPHFQEIAGQYFEMGEPYAFDDFKINYRLFPQGKRSAASRPPVKTELPKMLIVPLRLKDES